MSQGQQAGSSQNVDNPKMGTKTNTPTPPKRSEEDEKGIPKALPEGHHYVVKATNKRTS